MKKLTALILTLVLLVSALPLTVHAADPGITVIYNGTKINFTQPPTQRNGFVFYPLEDVLKVFCGGHEWNAETFTISGTLNGNTVAIPLKDLCYIVNGKRVEVQKELVWVDEPAS